MELPVLIIEPHAELATALEKAIASASYTPVVRRHVDSLDDLDFTPVTIVMRIGHADVSHLPSQRPPIVAIASSDEDVAEAARLRCEVVLHGAPEIRRLCEALRSLAHE
jgi:alkanesulfonate monooxygenase SsuD/methylene tetrahydromethanopterin reductase-like flavin-dependent oxidoreductase (luciferase family)